MILKANHLAKDIKEVERKAKTILKQCDRDGDGKIDKVRSSAFFFFFTLSNGRSIGWLEI